MKQHVFTRRAFSRGFVLTAPALITARPSNAQTGDREALVAAAKREGRVIVYSAYVSPLTHEPINKAFEQKYGIRVETFMARGPELRERMRVEALTGRFLGDVQHNASSTTMTMSEADKIVEPHGGLPGAARLKPEYAARADARQVPIFTINYGLLVNTAMVRDGDEPGGWLDLLDPKWKGKVLFDDPRATGGGRVMFHMTTDRFGREFHEKMARQEPGFSRDYGEAVRRVTRGEFAIYAPLIFSQAAPLKGLPVKYIVPREGVTYGSYCVSILRNPPHPAAARLLADFYLSDEAQGVYANTGHGVVIGDLKTPVAPDMRPLAGVKPLVDEDFTRIEPYLALAREIYK